MAHFNIPDSGLGIDPKSKGSNWPKGEYAVPHGDLTATILLGAHHHAHRSLQNFVSDDHLELLDAALSAGTALELTCKAALAQIEPILLAERVDRDTLLRLSGKGDYAVSPPTRIRTIGAVAAFTAVRHFHKTVAVAESEAREVFETRNAAVHVGLVDRTEVRTTTSTMARAVDSILEAMGADRPAFWGSRAEMIEGLMRQQEEIVAQIVSAKFAAARSRVNSIVLGLDPDLRRTILSALSTKRSYMDREESIECPVCMQHAWLICSVEEGQVHWDSDPDGAVGWTPRTAFPLFLDCSVCSLTLDQAELAHLDLDNEIELEPREEIPSDEPDEDIFRDR